MRILLDLPEDLLEKIRNTAKESGMSRKAYVEQLIMEFAGRKVSFSDGSEAPPVGNSVADEISVLLAELAALGDSPIANQRKRFLKDKVKKMEKEIYRTSK